MASKKELLAQEVAKAVGAGKAVALETVDFNDPNRPKTCLEVDFPILPINQIAAIESSSGAATKPIYQMSKWWARRPSSVFRSMLLAAATRAPEDAIQTSKLVWDTFYSNVQKKRSFSELKVADIFMGGGTTLVEGARLGMKMIGNDLNPVAWFVVKQELADVDLDAVNRLLNDIEAEVRPQIMPYYFCDGPGGEKGVWTHIPTKQVMPADFDPLEVSHEDRGNYSYSGPELVYTFWAKHGPCQVTGCRHRTPILSSPVIATKKISVNYWDHTCKSCGIEFQIEEECARLAPDVPLFVASSEQPHSVLNRRTGASCPSCGEVELLNLGKSKSKKIELTLLIHPSWLAGSPSQDAHGNNFGGTTQDDAESTARWNHERALSNRLLEVRGELPTEVTCPDTGVTFPVGAAGGTIPKKSHYACGSCGTVQEVLETVSASGKTGPVAGYAIQAYSPDRDRAGMPYGGRFFAPFGELQARQNSEALREWEARKEGDLSSYWPRSDIPFGHMTHQRQPLPQHGYKKWAEMFNARQLLVHSILLKAIAEVGGERHSWETREFVLGAFQQFLRFNCMFTVYHPKNDQATKHFANNNFHPRNTLLEVSVFSPIGDGRWVSAGRAIVEGSAWRQNPWDLVPTAQLAASGIEASGKSEKVFPKDPPLSQSVRLSCGTSSDLVEVADSSIDLVITDPPFGGLVHYSELSDFFYVWLRLLLKDKYPDIFAGEYSPKSLEAVTNPAREPDDADAFYQRLLTQCWSEANRILKPGGILAFTFHHSEDEPWVAVLESLFDSGYYLEATYPIRADTSMDTGQFGSKTIEYDIIHVCRKRIEEPQPVSWGRMRREVMADVRQLQAMLENHAKGGLPAADIQVIRRGKALEYFSRHYGKVYVDEGRAISVREALVGINQLIDEDAETSFEQPPVNAEPITRQFLRIFRKQQGIDRDQMQKLMRGSGIAPDEFEHRGWCSEKSKVFTRVDPLDFARDWSGKHKRRLTSDLDQALVLIGSCFDGSGINASDTLKNENFKPHVALKPLLEWLQRNGPDQTSRNAASRAVTIYNSWAASQATKPQQGSLFEEYDL